MKKKKIVLRCEHWLCSVRKSGIYVARVVVVLKSKKRILNVNRNSFNETETEHHLGFPSV